MIEQVSQLLRGWRKWPVMLRDGVGAVLLFVLSVLPLGIGGLQLGDLPAARLPWAIILLLTGAQTLPLAARRRWSAPALAVIGVGYFIGQATGANTGLAGLGVLVALYSCSAYLRRGRVTVAAAVVVVYGALVAVLIVERAPQRPIDWVTFVGVLVLPWVLGELVRRRMIEHAARVDRAAADAVTAARALLARDLHDIVTHHVTAMVVQAESARYLPLTAEGDAERSATFASLGSTGRQALGELRSLLGALDPEHDERAPRHDDILQMVERLQATGYPIVVEVEGSVSDVLDPIAAVMRSVAREAVTNAMKHARGREVRIELFARPAAFGLTVVNEAEARQVSSGGRGLAGMSERIRETAGTFEAGLRGGEFVVRAEWAR